MREFLFYPISLSTPPELGTTLARTSNRNGKLDAGGILMSDILFISIVMSVLVFLMLWNLYDQRRP